MQIAAIPLLLLASCGNPDQVTASALQQAVDDSPAKAFYQHNGWVGVWSHSAAQTLRKALDKRAAHGLDQVVFLRSDRDSAADREIALTQAALAYAAALAHGVADPHDFHRIYEIPRPEPDLVAGLSQALESGKLDDWLASLAPQDDEYRALSKIYVELREQAKQGQQAIPEGALIRPGQSDPRVPLIVQALTREGFLDSTSETGPSRYAGRIVAAVRAFQADRGMKPDGIVGSATIGALNIGPDERMRAAAVALERRRWLTRNPPATRIDVNTAAAELQYFRGGRLADRRRVVVGQPDWQTPQLQSDLYRLVANPTWTVPKSIEQKELAKLGEGYLRRHNMVRRDNFIVQLSGPDNALGLVKFDLDNDHAIYLHDTPSKPLFARPFRQLSHGCVRVDDALGFAAMIARDEGVTDEWDEALQAGKEAFVSVPHRIPVRLMYHPTYLSLSGKVVFSRDVYGWNEPIARALNFGRGSSTPFVPDVSDLGP
jgi:L,D-transpeptidase YcbB